MVDQHGAVVDESLSESGESYLYYAYYDEKGRLMYFADFNRNVSPEEISEVLNSDADSLLHSRPEGMCLEMAFEKAEELRKLAKSVPGLGIK